MNTNPSISFSPETLDVLAEVICSLYPTNGDFWCLLDSVKQQIPLKTSNTTPRTQSFPFCNDTSGLKQFYEPSFSVQAIPSIPQSIAKTLQQLYQPELIKVLVENVFNPRKFLNRADVLNAKIKQFNTCLSFDGWRIQIQQDGSIGFVEAKPDLSTIFGKNDDGKSGDKDFSAISFDDISRNLNLTKILRTRLQELRKCLEQGAPLASIILAGSILEGTLRGIAEDHPHLFNTAKTAPKNGSTVRPFREWSLANFIDVAFSVGFLNKGTREFNHTLRDFRNYIHPYEQLANRFDPDMATARLCFQTMKETILHLQQQLKDCSPPLAP